MQAVTVAQSNISQSLAWTLGSGNIYLAGYTLKRKFKGHQNRTTQIRASMGVPADFLICGSDDGWVYVWDLAGSDKAKDAASKQVHTAHPTKSCICSPSA